MISKIWLINLILAACAVVLGMNAYSVWTQDGRKPDMEIIEKSEIHPGNKRNGTRKTLPESAYRVIVDKNLFSPDREEFIPPEESVPEVKQINVSGRKITLYGVIIMDDYQKALIDNPVREADERPSKWVAVGDTVGDLTIAAINRESIMLKEGSKKYEILLYDEKKRRTAAPAAAKSASPNVVSTQPKVIKPSEKSSPEKEEVSDVEYEIVKTPFGDIKRRKKK